MTEALLHLLAQQALLLSAAVLALAAARPLLRRGGAGATYAAWALLPALLITPALPRPAEEPLRLVLTAVEAPALAPTLPLPAAGSPWPAVLLAVWLAGVVAVLAVQMRRQWRLARLGPHLPAGHSPALVGLLRPRIALPADFARRFSPQEQALILAHEAVHRRRHDNAFNALAAALAALHWWNPLARWAARRFQADQELACDAAVLAAHPGNEAAYSRALLAAHGLTPHGAPLASAWGSSHPLVERIAILNHRPTLTRRRAAALVLALSGAVGLAYAAQVEPTAPPQQVEIRLAINADGQTLNPRLITALGVPARIEWGDKPDAVWRIDMTVDRAVGDQLKTVTQVSFGGKAVGGHHTGYLKSGESFGHNFGAADTPNLQFTRVLTLLPLPPAPPPLPTALPAPPPPPAYR